MTDKLPPSASPANASFKSVDAWQMRDEHTVALRETVIAEQPIALLYNGIAHAVMMATPCDLEDFALGFSLSEAVVASPSEWRFIEAHQNHQGVTIEMHIPQARFEALQARQQRLIGTSACGMCGMDALLPAPPVLMTQTPIHPHAITTALRAMVDAQALNHACGGAHAAGFAHSAGVLVREDVGRHNALDKMIGACARAGISNGFVVMSSRASYELVHKTANAGIPLLATVSAATTAAIDLAHTCGLTLIAFARDDRMTIYTHPGRVV